VQSLLDKSLLQQREGVDGEPRFWMLETIQEYATEKLEESGEAEAVRNAHLSYFTALVEGASAHLIGAKQQEWLERLEEEHDNARAALGWSVYGRAGSEGSSKALEMGLRLAAALARFWQVRGYLTEGREWLSALVAGWESAGHPAGRTAGPDEAETGGSVVPASLARALRAAGTLAHMQADLSVASALLEQALEMGRAIGDKEVMTNSLNGLALVAHDRGDYSTARSFYEQNLALSRELGDKWGMSTSLNNLGNASYAEGDYPAARSYHEESLALKRELGDKSGISISLNNQANVAVMQGDHQAARVLHEESLALRRELGDTMSIALNLAGLAEAWAETEQSTWVEKGTRLLGASDAVREALDVVMDPDDRKPYEHVVAMARSLLGEEQFERLRAEGREMSLEQAIEYALPPVEDESAKAIELISELNLTIDKEKKARQVAAIIETDYFRELQAKLQSLRSSSN
jgi:tetratricopeptide (TPR) repeat protein